MAIKKKIVFLPYDFDTAIGINNEGALVFSYNLEDIDQTEGGADIFNGQQSVLWKNMRAAFFDEMKAMYQNLRSTGALSYDKVERMFEEHQAKWPEAVFNEDAWFKYLAPLVEKGNASYLSMLQGSKAEQRKWWLYNRFRYIDSKYNAGDALTDVITVRGYAKSNITVTPYADVYASIKYGSYLVQTRAQRNRPYTLVCPLDNVNDTEIYIYSASQLASVGDLSGLLVGYADFSRAVKLQSLKLGDADANYSNGNLTELYLGNNELLRSIDVRNCPALTQAVDVSGCINIEHVYFDGTSITGLSLPNGGILKTLHLPAALTNLTIRNQTMITDFTIPTYENISTLRLENVSQVIDPLAILRQIQAGSRVRIIGFSIEAEDTDEIRELMSLLDTMRGLDENGGNTETAQVSGTVHVEFVTGAELVSFHDRYPDIMVTYDHVTSNLYYYDFEGEELFYTETISDGGDGGAYTERPAKEPTAANTYEFLGWSKRPNSTSVDADALLNVTADRRVYAAYRIIGQTYRVRFYTGNTLLLTVNNVPYGGRATFTGDTPAKTDVENPEDYQFVSWNPSPVGITGNTDCYAQFRYTGLISMRLMERNMSGEYVNARITSIGKHALESNSMITGVSFPNVTAIGEYGLRYCSGLLSADLPELLTVGTSAFDACTKMESINAPKLQQIGSSAFYSCKALTSMSLPNIQQIGSSAFSSCYGMQSYQLGDGLTKIGDYAFYRNYALTELILGPNVSTIGIRITDGCTILERVEIRSVPTRINAQAFTNTPSLTDIYVPWAEGEVADAPWGAENATIHYETSFGEGE